MAAVLTLHKYTGASAATESAAISGADLSSADNDTNTLGNRQANPISVGTNSFETWLKLKVDTAPANACANFKVWGDGAIQDLTTLMYAAAVDTGVTPVNDTSVIAVDDFSAVTSGAKATWDDSSLTTIDDLTKFLVFQLQVDSASGAGNWEPETVNYSFDET